MVSIKNTRCPKGYILRKGYTRKFRQSIATSGYTVRRKGTHEDIMPYDFYAHCCLVVHANIQKKELPCSANNV